MNAKLGSALARYLGTPGRTAATGYPVDIGLLSRALLPGDVILVEGNSRVSVAIKYLTQSTWSHAALYVGDLPDRGVQGKIPCVVEADINAGVRAVPLSAFDGMNCRICRAAGLSAVEVQAVCQYAIDRLGEGYDLKNVFDLARYLFPTPPVPLHWRRKMLALGSGDPTRAICSTLIAQAFQSVSYPILPNIESVRLNDPNCAECIKHVLHVRDHSLYVPRDFDVSPYFAIVKPTLVSGFDFHALNWGADLIGSGLPSP